MTRPQMQAKIAGNADSNRVPAEDRRRQIAAALEACIREQGYSATSLSDIAARAGLSPSHLRYFFATKDDILCCYFESLCENIMADLMRIKRTTPDEWLEAFAGSIIGSPKIDRNAIGGMIEVFGVALHHPALEVAKTRYDNFIRRLFLDFFLWAGTARGIDPNDAAYTGWSLEVGMKMNLLFQPDFSHANATAIFLREMRRMANLPAPISKRGKAKRADQWKQS